MAQADGSIIIDTQLNADGMKAGSKEIEASVRRMAASVDGLGTKAKTALNKQIDSFIKQNREFSTQAKKVDELREKVEEYANQKIPTNEYNKLQQELSEIESQYEKLNNQRKEFESLGVNDDSLAYKFLGDELDKVYTKAETVRSKMKKLESSGKAFTFGAQTKQAASEMEKLVSEDKKLSNMVDRIRTSYSSIEGQINDYKKSLLEVNAAQNKASKSSNKFSKSLKNTGKSAKSAQFGIGKMLGTAPLFRLVFQGISAATHAIQKGFQKRAQDSGETNSTLSLLWSSLERLQNSLATAFAPILNTIAPILTQFIDMLSTAATYVSMFFAFLSGQSTYIKAVAVQKDYAASLKDTAGAANDAADAMNNYLSPLDDLNKYEDPNKNIGGGASAVDPSQMFETVELDSVPAFEKIKEILTQIFSPFKAAWEKEGKATIDSAKAALKSLGELAQSVGRSMLNVWNNGTGTIILSTMLQIAQHLFELIGNIAERLNFAWNTNSAGIQIIQNIANIFQTILDFINRIVLSTADWAASLNFYPLLQAIGNLLSSLQPIIEAIGNFLSNIYEAIILPIASYVIEYMLPGIIEVLSGFFAFLGENQWIIEAVGAALIAAFSVKKFTPLATGIVGEIKKIIGVMTGSGGIITAIKGVVSAMGGPLSIAITAGIALLILLVSHWDEVKAAMSKFDEWLQGIFEKDWTETFGVLGETLNIFSSGLQDIWNGIKNIFNGIIAFVKGVFTGNWKQAWDGIKQIFKGVWDIMAGIIKTPINAIIGGINGLISGVVSGINAVIRALNHLSFKIPSWVPAFGGKKFGFNMTPLTAPKIPYLAQGAVIPPNREFMAVLGDQKHGNNIETPESLLRDIIRQELNSGNGEEQRIIIQVDRKTLFEAVLKEKRLRQRQTGMDPLTT